MVSDAVDAFFEKVDRFIGQEREFSIMTYPRAGKYEERTLLKILMDDEAQFAVETTYKYWRNYLRSTAETELLYNNMFTKNMVKEDISIPEIMHDAEPAEYSLRKHFTPDSNSLYKGNPPLGINGGKLKFTYRTGGTVGLELYDLSQENDMSGTYEMIFTDESKHDTKSRMSTVVRLKKTGLLR